MCAIPDLICVNNNNVILWLSSLGRRSGLFLYSFHFLYHLALYVFCGFRRVFVLPTCGSIYANRVTRAVHHCSLIHSFERRSLSVLTFGVLENRMNSSYMNSLDFCYRFYFVYEICHNCWMEIM